LHVTKAVSVELIKEDSGLAAFMAIKTTRRVMWRAARGALGGGGDADSEESDDKEDEEGGKRW
jgi:hypothetical protein